MNKINFSADYFLLTNNTISLLFMWILWNKSASKCLHTLHNISMRILHSPQVSVENTSHKL